MKRSILTTLAPVILTALLLPAGLHPCVIAFPTAHVGRAFRVKVTDRGRPVGGLKVALWPTETVDGRHPATIHSSTDARGYASFAGLNEGSFLLAADHDGVGANTVVVKVSQNGRTNQVVPLRWPGSTPLLVRSVSGIVHGPNYDPNQTQVHLSLSLVDAVSGQPISNTSSSVKGEFHFADELRPGVYFLRLNPSGLQRLWGGEIEGMIPVELSQTAERDSLDLDLSWSDCGLGYSQRAPQRKTPSSE